MSTVSVHLSALAAIGDLSVPIVVQSPLNVKSPLNGVQRVLHERRLVLYACCVESDDEEVAAALATLDATLDALRSRDDTRGKFRAFGDLAEGLRDRSETAATERREVAARIKEHEKVSLGPLADELGISKTRLHQLINADKKDRKKEKADVRADDDLG